jgi:hypothetical protein
VGFGFACTHGYYPARLSAAVSLPGSFFRTRFPLQGSSHLDKWIDATKPCVQSFSSERLPSLNKIAIAVLFNYLYNFYFIK